MEEEGSIPLRSPSTVCGWLNVGAAGKFGQVYLNNVFKRVVDIPRIMHGERQEFEMLISEEALLFAKYLRNEREDWIPRICILKS